MNIWILYLRPHDDALFAGREKVFPYRFDLTKILERTRGARSSAINFGFSLIQRVVCATRHRTVRDRINDKRNDQERGIHASVQNLFPFASSIHPGRSPP